MTKESLTQAELKEFLHYNPFTGIFTWIKYTANSVKIGDNAGCVGSSGYIQIRLKGKKYAAHRLAFLYMTGKLPEEQADHINHIRIDNRWKNLREATNQENSKNMSMKNSNTSGVTGICWDRRAKKWQARIMVDGKNKHLGLFEDINWAIFARWLAEDKLGFHKNHGT